MQGAKDWTKKLNLILRNDHFQNLICDIACQIMED